MEFNICLLLLLKVSFVFFHHKVLRINRYAVYSGNEKNSKDAINELLVSIIKRNEKKKYQNRQQGKQSQGKRIFYSTQWLKCFLLIQYIPLLYYTSCLQWKIFLSYNSQPPKYKKNDKNHKKLKIIKFPFFYDH